MSRNGAKAELRSAALERRTRAAESGDGTAGAARLSEVLGEYAGRLLAGYVAMRGEIDPLPALRAHRGPLCLPVVTGRAEPLRFRTWQPGEALVAGAFGTREPASGGWVAPQVLIVPLVAFDRRGHRLGYGAGHYDRTLAKLRATGPITAIGFAWAAQEVAELPAEPTDQALDLIVTEAGVILPC